MYNIQCEPLKSCIPWLGTSSVVSPVPVLKLPSMSCYTLFFLRFLYLLSCINTSELCNKTNMLCYVMRTYLDVLVL
jgi:hypothetical protein